MNGLQYKNADRAGKVFFSGAIVVDFGDNVADRLFAARCNRVERLPEGGFQCDAGRMTGDAHGMLFQDLHGVADKAAGRVRIQSRFGA